MIIGDFHSYVNDLSWSTAFVLVIFISIVIAFILVAITRKFRNFEVLSKNYRVLQVTMPFIGILFSVQVSTAIVLEQNWLNDGTKAIRSEAAYLVNMLRDSREFAPKGTPEINNAIFQYLHYLIENEWHHLEDGSEIDQKGDELISNLWQALKSLPANADKEKIWYYHSLTDLDAFVIARTDRLALSKASLHDMLWSWILILGCILVLLASLLPIENYSLNLFVVAVYTSVIAIVLYITFTLDHPFQGQIRVSPVEYENILKTYENKVI